MKYFKKILTVWFTLILSFLLTSCLYSQPLIPAHDLTAKSGEIVKIKAAKDAKGYRWIQLSSKPLVLVGSDEDTLSFVAPDIEKDESFVFDLQVVISTLFFDDVIKKESVKVVVSANVKQTNPKLTLNVENPSLAKGNSTNIKVTAYYSDNTSKDVTNEVEWVYTKGLLNIQDHTLTANGDTNTIIQAKLNNINSNPVTIELYKEINGHRLPPMPNKAINDSTLLGIDSNNNDVRDDVEIKIYTTYDKEINRKMVMQGAKTHQLMLGDSELIKNALKWEKFGDYRLGCLSYLFRTYDIDLYGEIDFIEENTYNTVERIKKYMKYNQALSGGVYGTEESYKAESSCDFNVTKALSFDK